MAPDPGRRRLRAWKAQRHAPDLRHEPQLSATDGPAEAETVTTTTTETKGIRGMSNWIVYAENSVYWNVGELVENPPDWGKAHMRPGEIACKPICRVCKTAGRHVLDLILAAGEARKEAT